jgi:hypothetical protein
MKKTKSPQLLRAVGLFSLTALLMLQFVSALLTKPAYADQITNRSLTLIAGTTDGGSKPGGVVNHKFTFTIPSGTGPTYGSLQSIKFQYCTTAADVVNGIGCVAPTGLSAGSATLASETGSGITGMSMHAATGPDYNSFYLSRASSFSLASGATVTYTIGNVTNPTANNATFFVRITTYATADATGAAGHKGTVAATTNLGVVIDGTMPESLVFCTGATIGVTSSVPDCGTVTTGTISFNSLFSPTATASTTSQMAASTNAGSGYVITVNGATLTSGSNTIAAMNAPAASLHGVSQFGLNLTTNTIDTVATGTALTPTSNTVNYRGQPLADYATSDSYKFLPGDAVANSGNSVLGGTDAQIYTVTYIANVPGSLPAGNYSTTLTYICTPTY